MPKPDDSHLDGPNALDDSAALDESGAEEREPESRAGLPTETRVIRALQVAGVLGFTLLIVGLVASRLRPPVLTGQRSLVTTPFLWAIVLWTAALVFDAVAFRTSQLDLLIKRPLQVAAALSGALLVVGIAATDFGTTPARTFAYLVTNAAGTAMFWWAAFSLGWLIMNREAR